MSYVKYIADVHHYNEVLSKVASVKKSLWIGTAAIEHFDSVWAGFRCKACSRKKFCGDPIIP